MTKSQTKIRQQEARSTSGWLYAAMLGLLGLLAYANSFNGALVFDDLDTIRRNAGLQAGDFLNPLSA